MIGSFYELTDGEIVDLMIGTDTEMFTRPLSDRFHSAKWWALESILRERHGTNWFSVLSETM